MMRVEQVMIFSFSSANGSSSSPVIFSKTQELADLRGTEIEL